MKKITLILIALIGLTTFAQKAEVKSAEKALKKGDLTAATEMINQACKLKDQADDKTKAKILFVKAQILAKKGSANVDNYTNALKAINELEAFEKQIGKERYSDDAKKLKLQIGRDALAVANNELAKPHEQRNYKTIATYEQIAYNINHNDKIKYIIAFSKLMTKDYNDAEPLLKELYESGYTGEEEYISLLNKETNKRETIADEKTAKLLVASGKYTDMKKEKTKSVRPDIISNLLFVYGKQGKDDAVISFIEKAKKEDPNNIDLIIGEGNYYLKKGNKEKFAAAMKKAVDIDPENYLYNYNLATAYYQMGKFDDAKKYYEKTVKLKPDYIDAYLGIAYIILAPEEGITKEMNKDEVLMNDALYNKYNNQRLDLYRKVLPVLEQALSQAPNHKNILVMLKKIYRDLDMKSKYKEVKAKLDSLK